MKNWHFIAILIVFIFAELLILTPEISVPSQNFMAAVLPATIIDRANVDRQMLGQTRLRENLLLTKAAELKARDMATRGYFSHTGPSGETPWMWLDKVGYDYVYAGENLAVNYFDSTDVHQAWMNSALHRDNLLDSKFSEIGVGVAWGKFNGRDSLYVVEFLGTTEDSNPSIITSQRDDRQYLLSAVSLLPERFLKFNRQIFLPVLELAGYQVLSGKII